MRETGCNERSRALFEATMPCFVIQDKIQGDITV